MGAESRQKIILEALKERGVLKIEDIAELTQASLPTVRRDVSQMEKTGLVRRFRGGVLPGELKDSDNDELLRQSETDSKNYSFRARIQENQAEKAAIGRKAAELVRDGDVIFIDSGSTTYQMCDALRDKKILAVTNNIFNAVRLRENGVRVYVAQGEVVSGTMSMLGQDTIKSISAFCIDKAFIGASGVDSFSGYSTVNISDRVVKQYVLKHGREAYVLADHTKIGKRAFYSYGNLSDAVLITCPQKTDVQLSGIRILDAGDIK